MSSSSNASGSGDSAQSQYLFYEKLRPSPWMWVLVLLFGGLGFLVLAPIEIWLGVISAIVAAVITLLVLISTNLEIIVTEDFVQVGRAGIERKYVGEVIGYRGHEAFVQRGQKLHGWAYVALRSWASPVVRIQITDENDRTPYWLTSTRHPEELVAALGGHMYIPPSEPNEDEPEWVQEAEQMRAQYTAGSFDTAAEPGSEQDGASRAPRED